jgi:pimeloyl-ACP methyl ester carboxylesterase
MVKIIHFDRFVIPYRVYGSRGQAIVCVNGAQQTMAVWRSFISFFSKKYRVVVFDFPGQGRSKITAGGLGISFDEQIETLHTVVEAVAPGERVILSGASWGSIVAAGFAAKYPALVDKVLLGSFGVKPSSKMAQVISRGQQMYRNGKGNRIGRLLVNEFGQKIPEALRGKIINQFERMVSEHFEAFREHSEFVGGIGHLEDIVRLEDIRAKTMIVNGEHDTLLNLEDIEIAKSKIPDCESMIVKDTGHFLHFERPEILRLYQTFFLS